MASTEVGTAYVAIIPSAKGFARTLQKDIAKEFTGSNLDKLIGDALAGQPVTIPVKPDLDPRDTEIPVRPGQEPKLPVKLDPLTKALQDTVRRQLAALSREVSVDVPVTAETDELRGQISEAISSVEQQLSAQIPTEPAERREYERSLRAMVDDVENQVRARIETEVNVNEVDRDGRTIGSRLTNTIGDTVRSGLSGGSEGILGGLGTGAGAVGGVVGTALGTPIAVALGIAAAPIIASVIGGAVSAGILGGIGAGVLGIGALALRNDPELQQAVAGFTGTISQELERAAEPLRGPLIEGLDTIAQAFQDVAPDLRAAFEAIAPAIGPLAAGIAEFIRAAMPGILEAVKATAPFIESIAYNLGPLGEAVSQFFGSIAQTGPGATKFINVILELVGALIVLTGEAIRVMATMFNGLYITVEAAADLIGDAWHLITGAFSEGGASIRQIIDAAIGWIIRTVKAGMDFVTRTAGNLPGRIKGALGNLGNLLYQAGRNVVQGLIDGIRSMFGRLGSAASSLAQTIRDYLPFSPAKEGPLSGRGNPFYSGQSIVNLLASGVTSTLGAAEHAAADLAETFALSSHPTAGLSLPASVTAPPPASLVAEWVGGTGDPIVNALREHVRIYYRGSTQAAFGTGV